jgi:hypothetical protein
MVPVVGTANVELTVGVPVAEMVNGTLVLAKVLQVDMVKEKADEAGAVPQPVIAVTLQ